MFKAHFINKNTISAAILAFFLGSIGFVAVYTELFHKKDHKMPFPQLFNNPFTESSIATIHTISIKNKFTEVKMIKENNRWNMSEPKKLPTKNDLVTSLFNDLKTYDIKKIFDKDTINIKSFSLDTPQIEISMKSNIEDYRISIGLTNPVNNTTYLMLSNSEYIFQVTALRNDLSSLALTDFVETRIFNIDFNELTSLEFFKGESKKPFLEAYLKKTEWQDEKSELLNPDKLKMLWSEITKYKAQMILDEVDADLKIQIDDKMNNTPYTVLFKDNNNKVITLKFSQPINKLGNIKLTKGNSILVQSDQSPNTYLFEKDIMKIFTSSTPKLKGLNLRNIFY